MKRIYKWLLLLLAGVAQVAAIVVYSNRPHTLCVFMIAGNTKDIPPPGLTMNSQIAYLESKSPEDCADECIENKLYFLLGCQGYSLTIPGIPLETSLEGFEVLTIFGTTDYITSEESARLNDLAGEFAEKFNVRIFDARTREMAGRGK